MPNPYVLTSTCFTLNTDATNKKIRDCLDFPTKHFKFGDQGPHIGRMQQALRYAAGEEIDQSEYSAEKFGASTKKAVHTYKSQHVPIIKSPQEKHVDSKCGARTLEYLDREMTTWEAGYLLNMTMQDTANAAVDVANNILNSINQ